MKKLATRRKDRPPASSPLVRRVMRAIPRRDTAIELAIRAELHRRGLRYFVDRRPVKTLNRKADIVFPVLRIAVFIDGCFWHGCAKHSRTPRVNRTFWRRKIRINKSRDKETVAFLRKAGWMVLRFWEHDDPVRTADRVAAAVAKRRERPSRLRRSKRVRALTGIPPQQIKRRDRPH